MLTSFKFDGFPKEVGKEIELPNIAELLLYPFFLDISADEFYKHGTDLHRKLINSAPLKHDMKYVTVTSHIQLLSPGVRAVYNKIGYNLEWHIDSKFHDDANDRFHILMTDCSALTEFNESEVNVEVDSEIGHFDFLRYINDNEEKLGLKPRKVEPNKFTTFTNHIHRAIDPIQHEFRYFIRIIESNNKAPGPKEKSFNNHSSVQIGRESVKNVIHTPDSVVIQSVKPHRFR